MEKRLRDITYDELSCILLLYLDKGETLKALEYCQRVAESGNPYGYMFMGFIYEEGHGSVKANYRKAKHCYEMAEKCGVNMARDIMQVQDKLKELEEIVGKDKYE